MCWNCLHRRTCGGPWIIGIFAILVVGGLSLMTVGCCVDANTPQQKPDQQIPVASGNGNEQKAIGTSADLEAKFHKPGELQTVDLQANVVWRQVTIFDRETGTVLESHLTAEPVDVGGKHIQCYGHEGHDPSSRIVNGNVIISIVPTDDAEKIKDNEQTIMDRARKDIIDLGLSVN